MKNVRYVGEIISPDEEVLLSAVQLNLEANTHKISIEVHHNARAEQRYRKKTKKKTKKKDKETTKKNTHKIPDEVLNKYNAFTREKERKITKTKTNDNVRSHPQAA